MLRKHKRTAESYKPPGPVLPSSLPALPFLTQQTHREVQGFGIDLSETPASQSPDSPRATVYLCVPRGRSGPGIENVRSSL